jgi:hypothetical protein
MMSIAVSNASASRDAAISWSARRRNCALHRGEQEAALEFPTAVEMEHRLGPTPAVRRHPRAGQRRPHVLLAVVEVLDGDAP